MDKTGRNGLRIGDTTLPDFKERYQKLVDKHLSMLTALYGEVEDFSEREKAFFEAVELLQQFPLVDSEHLVTIILNRVKPYLQKAHRALCLISTLAPTLL